MKKLFFFVSILCFLGLIAPVPYGLTQAPPQQPSEVVETEIDTSNFFNAAGLQAQRQATVTLSQDEEQMARINKSLKHLVEENQKMLKDNETTENELSTLRGERVIQDNRLTALVGERERLLKKSKEIEQIRQDYEKQIQELKDELDLKMQTPDYKEAKHIRDLLEETGQPVTILGSQPAPDIDGQVTPTKGQASPAQIQAKPQPPKETNKEMAELIAENQILKKDTIKLHYNLANLFFEQGKYEMAAAEYKRVSALMPQDAATHYNLAFVCENYLKDKKTALLHYSKYVQLSPNAPDATLVKNKISELKLEMKAKIDSLLERDKPHGYE